MRICFNPLNDRRIKLQEADSNRRSQEYESCEIPFLYPAIYVSFQHICTGSPQADCFLHLGQHPHISYSDEIMGEDGVEPPEPESNRFTVCTATSTEYSPKTRAPRVSNMFIVLCFPLSTSFSAVDSLDIFMRLSWVVPFKNSLFQRALR